VAEETDGQDTGIEASGAGVDPAAVALALVGASRETADAFLNDQRQLIASQDHHLKEQLKRLKMAIISDRLSITLKVLTGLVGVAVAAGLALMIWDAAHSKGLVIEPFSVPSDIAERGLTGQVIASQMIDKLTEMTTHESSRAYQSYANNWGDNIKVEIPETGVSIGELQNFLKDWLGHDIHISGEVFRTSTGISVTARTGGNAGASFSGAETDLDSLLQKAAEHVYEVTQPYRYANYLDRNYDPNGLQDRLMHATAIYRKLIAGDDLVERAWAWNGLGTIEFNVHGNNQLAAEYYKKSIVTVPDFTIGYFALASRNLSLNQEKERFENYQEADRLLSRETVPELNPHYTTYARHFAKAGLAMLTGDYDAATTEYQAGAELPDDFSVLQRGNFIADAAEAMALRHDLPAIRAYLHGLGDYQIRSTTVRIYTDLEAEDWKAVMGEETALRARIAQARDTDQRGIAQSNYEEDRYAFALAEAKLGDFKAAEATIAPTAADDDQALRMRGQIATMQGQHERADWWFARAEQRAPHVPFADMMRGQALLERGDSDTAIAKFTTASQKGPHFADPLEMWGEALMVKNRSDLALAKFTEAEKYAPNWGRLHLKWGEALVYAGRKDEAQKQYVVAAGLDLSAADKAELVRVSHG
jgi:tetratricopeptide (TPR) repeat protein